MAVNTQVLISFAKNCGASCKHPLLQYLEGYEGWFGSWRIAEGFWAGEGFVCGGGGYVGSWEGGRVYWMCICVRSVYQETFQIALCQNTTPFPWMLWHKIWMWHCLDTGLFLFFKSKVWHSPKSLYEVQAKNYVCVCFGGGGTLNPGQCVMLCEISHLCLCAHIYYTLVTIPEFS